MNAEFMAMLATEYQKGILITSGVLWAIYITLCVLSTIVRYKRVGKLSLLGTVPLFHISLFFMDSSKRKARKEAEKKAKADSEVFEDVF